VVSKKTIVPAEIEISERWRGETLLAIWPVIDVDGTDQVVVGTSQDGSTWSDLELTQDQAKELYMKLGTALGRSVPAPLTDSVQAQFELVWLQTRLYARNLVRDAAGNPSGSLPAWFVEKTEADWVEAYKAYSRGRIEEEILP
jgi:hypothetical protein